MTLISEAIKAEHGQLEEAYHRIMHAASDDERERWRNQFTWELARHAVGAELVLFPAFERRLPNGLATANSNRGVVGDIKEELHRFQSMPPGDARFVPTIEGLMQRLRDHMEELEGHDLVLLEKALDVKESEKLVLSFKRTAMFTPTRSHPGRRNSGPDRPPFDSVLGLLTSSIDHLSDLFRKFPAETKSPWSP